MDETPSVDFLPIRSIRIVRWTRLELSCATESFLSRTGPRSSTGFKGSNSSNAGASPSSSARRSGRVPPPLCVSLIIVVPHVEMPVCAAPKPPPPLDPLLRCAKP